MQLKSSFWCCLIAGGCILVTLAFMDRSCSSDAELRRAVAKYEAMVAERDAEFAAGQEQIAGLTADIARRDEAIAGLNASVAVKDAKITLLSRQLADIVGQEPPTTPEIESMPIVINLRAQVKTLNEIFTVAQETIRDKDDIIREWEAKFNSQFKITMEWKVMYDNEHALRVNCESLFKMSERGRKLNGKIAKVATIAGGAGLIYGLLK